jgi:hypothetical protein
MLSPPWHDQCSCVDERPFCPHPRVPFRDSGAVCECASVNEAGAKARDGMKQRTLQILYAYWDGLRAGRIAPLRLELDPSRIGSILPEILLLERVAADTYCYRLAGTRLCEIFGSELRGSNLLDGWTAADRSELERALALTCEQGAATHLTMEASAGSTRRVQLEALYLPLMHANNVIERVVGALSAITSPHWLGHDRLTDKRLLAHDLIWPDGRPQRALSASAQPHASMPPAPPAAGFARGDRPTFRVLDGGRKED